MGVLLTRNKKGMAGGPAAKKVCPTREGEHLEQEENKGRAQDSRDAWHSYRKGISSAKDIGGEESQRGVRREAQEEVLGGHVYRVHVAEPGAG